MNMLYNEIDKLKKENEELKEKVGTIERLCEFITNHRSFTMDISMFSDFSISSKMTRFNLLRRVLLCLTSVTYLILISIQLSVSFKKSEGSTVHLDT